MTRNKKKWHNSSIRVILKNKDKYEGGVRGNNEHNLKWPKILFYNKDELIEEEDDIFGDKEEKISKLIFQ